MFCNSYSGRRAAGLIVDAGNTGKEIDKDRSDCMPLGRNVGLPVIVDRCSRRQHMADRAPMVIIPGVLMIVLTFAGENLHELGRHTLRTKLE